MIVVHALLAVHAHCNVFELQQHAELDSKAILKFYFNDAEAQDQLGIACPAIA